MRSNTMTICASRQAEKQFYTSIGHTDRTMLKIVFSYNMLAVDFLDLTERGQNEAYVTQVLMIQAIWP